MIRGYKYRLEPNKEQADRIKRTIGCARFMYNILLEDYKEQLNNRIEDVPVKIKEVSTFKNKYEFLTEVDSLALANSKLNDVKDNSAIKNIVAGYGYTKAFNRGYNR